MATPTPVSAAETQTVVVMDTIPATTVSGLTNGNPVTIIDVTPELPRFDPNLGTLTGVTFSWTIDGTVEGSGNYGATAVFSYFGSETRQGFDTRDTAPRTLSLSGSDTSMTDVVGTGNFNRGKFTGRVEGHSGFFPWGATMTAQLKLTVVYEFEVSTRDTEAPVVTVPNDFMVGTDPGAASAVVDFSFSATDNVAVVSSGCSPASGSTFGLGVTQVTCSAVDAAGNSGTADFAVNVVDDEAPVVTVPNDITSTATGLDGAAVTFVPSFTDNVAVVSSGCSPASGSTFGLGVTQVTCSAVDAAGNSGTASFAVTVEVDGDSLPVLVDAIEGADLPRGVERSLLGPLSQFDRLLNDGQTANDGALCNKLDSFVAEVAEQQAEGGIDVGLAEGLIAFGEAVADSLGCP